MVESFQFFYSGFLIVFEEEYVNKVEIGLLIFFFDIGYREIQVEKIINGCSIVQWEYFLIQFFIMLCYVQKVEQFLN